MQKLSKKIISLSLILIFLSLQVLNGTLMQCKMGNNINIQSECCMDDICCKNIETSEKLSFDKIENDCCLNLYFDLSIFDDTKILKNQLKSYSSFSIIPIKDDISIQKRVSLKNYQNNSPKPPIEKDIESQILII